jgi:hypothetical protein
MTSAGWAKRRQTRQTSGLDHAYIDQGLVITAATSAILARVSTAKAAQRRFTNLSGGSPAPMSLASAYGQSTSGTLEERSRGKSEPPHSWPASQREGAARRSRSSAPGRLQSVLEEAEAKDAP